MIFESFPWKMKLKRHLHSFQIWSKKTGTQRGGFYIERGVFLSSFTVRKLMKNRKVTDGIRDRSIRCDAFRPFRPLSDRVSKFFGIFDPNREYDLTKSEKITISAYDLMSEIMHSYVFIPVIDDSEPRSKRLRPRAPRCWEAQGARCRLDATLSALKVPRRIRQALDGLRLLPVRQEPPVCCGASQPPWSRQRSSLLLSL